MELGFDIASLSARGRRPETPSCEFARELTRADLEVLANAPRNVEMPELKKITERHHALARALASGMRVGEAASLVGYEIARVSVLQDNPAFQELLSLYRDQKDLEFAEFAGRIAGLGKDAVLELQDRLEQAPEKFSNGMLLDMVKTLADRSGHGPTTKSEVTVNVTLGDRLAAARARARLAAEGPIRDITPPEAEQ